MNSTRSIFTDIRFAPRYHQDSTCPARPGLRRSISEFNTPFVRDCVVDRPHKLHKASTSQPSLTNSQQLESVPHDVRSGPPRGLYNACPSVIGRKRSAAPIAERNPRSDSTRKRRRQDSNLTGTRSPHSTPAAKAHPAVLPSPLFFSHSPTQRPHLPPRFSSSEAGAKMLSRTQGEDRSVKTVTLARGSFYSATNPSTPSRPRARTRYSSERNSVSHAGSRSPDGPERHTPSIVGEIGLDELFEQDQRPTFVVDLADTKNLHCDSPHIIYANSAFHQQSTQRPQQHDRIDESVDLVPCFENVPAVKAWIFGRANAEGGPSRYTQVLEDNNTCWTSTFLRKRYCVVSGTPRISPTHSSQILATTPETPPSITLGPTSSGQFPSASGLEDTHEGSPVLDEPQDYFRIADASHHDPSTSRANIPLPTIETTSSSSTSTEQTNKYFPQPRDDVDILAPEAQHVLSAAAAGNAELVNNASTNQEAGFFDWTRFPVSDALPHHIQFARSIDWGQTSLGSIETWSADLRQMCNLIMASPHPAAMYWGEDLVAIYNEAYVLLAGQKHPTLMGQSYRAAWAEIWDDVKDVFHSAQTTGQATMKDDDCLFIRRNDFLEETYFSWSIIPMVGGDGSVMGLYNPAFEKTRRKIAERRMLTLREIGERTAAARDVSSFWEEVLAALECNEFDTPFVLLYSLHGDSDLLDDSSVHSSTATGISSQRTCMLEGSLGVPNDHSAAPRSAELNGDEGYVPIFREVQKTNKAMVLDVTRGEIPPQLLERLNVRGFSDPVHSVVVCPIHPTTGESTLGFLVLGVNPRRPFDEDYNLFVQLLSRQLATSLASVVLFEEEIKRGQQAAKMAALDRIELSEQLAARTQEAKDSEIKFTQLAEFVPVGVFIGSSEGVITYCNESWFSITHVPAGNIETWMDYVKDDDAQEVQRLWHDLTVNKKSVSAEFRFKSPWTDRNGVKNDMWVLFSAYPERTPDGSLKSVFGSITNISNQKWAEGLQKRKMEEAVELKRQQENFIDITSHEMRNPLSAILQCADEITLSLGERQKTTANDADKVLFEDTIDAAHTIALCAQHQKRIVDDILTLSKLDSALLMVTPVDVQPVTVAQRALKMFEGEVQSADIEMRFKVDPSIQELDVDWCKLDPSRVLQVLINLTTNAIKFTTRESQRVISISLSASRTKFSDLADPVVSYFPSREKKYNSEEGAEWGDGEEIYIQFAVQDTGRGLTAEEKKLLFNRFAQASPRTHVQYGGSGLGLFISRELTELQNGQIGVASEAGKGSTFAFFIKARKTSPPSKATNQVLNLSGRQPTSKIGGRAGVSLQNENPAAKTSASIDGSQKKLDGTLRVLIVEDNLVNQRVLQKQLRNMGCETHVANHGGEALERLRESWFASKRQPDAIALDVVLMDQEMPVMDGITCTRKIRELERRGEFDKHVPVIAVTANARVEQIETARKAGMDDVVSKPFRIQELIPKMEELTLRYRQQMPT